MGRSCARESSRLGERQRLTELSLDVVVICHSPEMLVEGGDTTETYPTLPPRFAHFTPSLIFVTVLLLLVAD